MSNQFRVGGRNNQRKNPGIKGRRPDKYEERKALAEENLEVWRALTPEDQLRKLDARLGKGVGAVKQRARIQKKIDSEKEKERGPQPKKVRKTRVKK